MTSPILKQLGTIFVPVSDIEKARDWYCKLLNEEPSGEIIYGHLYIIPMNNSISLILDSKIYAPDRVFRTPSVQILTNDIYAAYQYMQDNDIELLTTVQHNKWFNFKDPDGNILMICS